MERKIALNSKESVYTNIRTSIINAQKRICRTVNSAIVQSYWEIGEQIYKECGEKLSTSNVDKLGKNRKYEEN